jgi:VCBS repeat-containing protein
MGPHAMGVGDFDNDDDQELAVANEMSNNVSVLLNNRAPSASGDAYASAQDTALDVGAPGVLGNDNDPDGQAGTTSAGQLTAALAAGPEHGTLTLNANGSFHYTPVAGYSGSDSFSYTVSDGHGGWNVATVSLTVKSAT